MQLMTKEIEKAFEKFPLYSQDGKGDEAKIIVKFFGGSAATWLITEGRKDGDDWLFFGKCTLGLPDPFTGGLLWEWGYVTLKELEAIRFPYGLGVERDLGLTPGRATVASEVF